MIALVIKSGPQEGLRIELEAELVIGREDADLVLDDSQVSRHHVCLRPTEAGVEVKDLGSTNGTHVQGVRIREPTIVGDGATVRVGKTTIAVEVTSPERRSETVVSATDAGRTVVGDNGEHTAERTEVPVRPHLRGRAAAGSAERTPTVPGAQTFGTFQSAPVRRRRTVATRLFVPMVLTYAAVGGTTAALIVYFLQR